MPFEFSMSGGNQRALRQAEYAVVDMTDGNLTIELHQLPIDFDLLVQTARASDLSDVDFWISTWNI